MLDKHDDTVADLNIHIKRLCSKATPAVADNHRLLSRKLSQLEEIITNIHNAVSSLPEDVEDLSLLQQYQERLSQCRSELSDANAKTLTLEDEGTVHGLLDSHSKLDKMLFECSHMILKLINSFHGNKATPILHLLWAVPELSFQNWKFQPLMAI